MDQLQDLVSYLDILYKSCLLIKRTISRLTGEFGRETVSQFVAKNKVTNDIAIECLQKSILFLLEEPERISKEIPVFASSMAHNVDLDPNLFLTQTWKGDVYEGLIDLDALGKLANDMRMTSREDQKKRWFEEATKLIPKNTFLKKN